MNWKTQSTCKQYTGQRDICTITTSTLIHYILYMLAMINTPEHSHTFFITADDFTVNVSLAFPGVYTEPNLCFWKGGVACAASGEGCQCSGGDTSHDGSS